MFIFTLSCFILGLYPRLAGVLVGKTGVPGVKFTAKGEGPFSDRKCLVFECFQLKKQAKKGEKSAQIDTNPLRPLQWFLHRVLRFYPLVPLLGGGTALI